MTENRKYITDQEAARESLPQPLNDTRMMLIYDIVSVPTVKLYITNSIQGTRIYDTNNEL